MTPDSHARYAAHVVVAYVLTFYVIWLIRREMLRFVHLRHQFLISKSHSKLAQAKTVLITSLPEDLTTEEDLRTFASFVPGGVAKIWIYRGSPELNEMYNNRRKACRELESAISKLLREATKAKANEDKARKGREGKAAKEARRQEKTGAKSRGKEKDVNGNGNEVPMVESPRTSPAGNGHHEDALSPSLTLNGSPPKEAYGSPDTAVDVERADDGSPEAILKKIKRPTHRLGWVPFVGKEIDTIDWATVSTVHHTVTLNFFYLEALLTSFDSQTTK